MSDLSYAQSLGQYNPMAIESDTAVRNSGMPKITPLNIPAAESIAGDTESPEMTAAASGADSPSFSDIVKNSLREINDKLDTADEKTKDLMVGKTGDTGAVVAAVEEANLALQFALAVKNKLLSSYQTISQLQY